MKYRVASRHPIDLADGRVFGPGEDITKLDADEPHNAALIADGALTPIEAKRAPAKKSTNNKEEDGK